MACCLRNLLAHPALFGLTLVASSASLAPGAAKAQVTNQFVPVAVIDTGSSVMTDAFGVAYDPVNDRIWHNSGSGSLFAFTPLKNLSLGALPIDGLTGLPSLQVSTGQTTPAIVGGIEAIGFDSVAGQLTMRGVAATDISNFDPFTAANVAVRGAQPTGSFVDGLDVEGADLYYSPEDGSRDSFKNGALFLDNTSVAQTDISAVSAGTAITRWAGIEAVTSLGFVYTVAEVDFGGGPVARTIATYDLLGNLFAVDPDGSPFASRLEDLAYDGRYLYGGSIGDSRIFVFDIVGPGGTVPVPATLGLVGIGLVGLGFGARRTRRG